MKKKTVGIIAGGCAVLLLAGAVVALELTKPAEEPEDNISSTSSSTSSETSRLLYDKDPAQVVSVDVKNEKGSYRVERYADSFWTIPEISGYPLNTAAINGIVEECATVTAKQVVVEKAEDLSIYGLAQPQIEAKAAFGEDGSEVKTLLIGDETPKGGTYYFKLDDEDTVYTIASSAVSYLFYGEYDCINKVMYGNVTDDDPEDDYDPAKINSITVKRADLDYEIKLEYDVRQDMEGVMTGNSSSHVMTEPVSLDLRPDTCDAVLNGIFSLAAEDVAEVAPDDAALEKYGLKEPLTQVDFDINAGKFRLLLGSTYTDENGAVKGYYGMADGIDIVYMFTKDSVPWAYFMPLDITMTMVTATYIYNLTDLEVTSEDRSAHFTITGEDDKTFGVSLDGAEFTDKDRFKSFYQYILRAPAEELYTDECTGEARITVKTKTAYDENVLEFIPDKDRMTIIRLNGRPSFRCRTAYVDRLIENLGHLLDGEDIVELW